MGSKQMPRIIGIREHISIARQQGRDPDGPVLRYFSVVIVAGLMAWSFYVVIGRVCVPMLMQREYARGTLAQGVVWTVLFVLLWSMSVWTYIVVVAKQPGFLKDVAPQIPCPEPPIPTQNTYNYPLPLDEDTVAGPRYTPSPTPTHNAETLVDSAANPEKVTSAPQPITPVAPAVLGPNLSAQAAMAIQEPKQSNSIPVSAKPARKSWFNFGSSSAATTLPTQQPTDLERKAATIVREPLPGRNALSLSEHDRWCTFCERVKLPRTHHCRRCGTCVLHMDHHCPWVAGCVGARNHKYFYQYLMYVAPYTFFTALALLLALLPVHSAHHVDVQMIVVAGIAVMFTVFTWGLLLEHTRLILLNISTVENASLMSQKRHEAARLDLHFAYHLEDKQGKRIGLWKSWRLQRAVKRRWKQEWGSIEREGNLYYLSARRNWEMVFGRNKWAWFLPIRARPGDDDGMQYSVNPRCSERGQWRPRKEWAG